MEATETQQTAECVTCGMTYQVTTPHNGQCFTCWTNDILSPEEIHGERPDDNEDDDDDEDFDQDEDGEDE